MVKLVIAMRGDNMALHERALAAAVKAAEQVNHGPAYRAWVEKVPDAPVYAPIGDVAELLEAASVPAHIIAEVYRRWQP